MLSKVERVKYLAKKKTKYRKTKKSILFFQEIADSWLTVNEKTTKGQHSNCTIDKDLKKVWFFVHFCFM